jgi:hypothetical protein
MLVSELVVEVRDPDLQRIGQIVPEDLVGATFVSRFNNVGMWELQLPYGHYLGELLRLPGYGIIVTGPSNEIIISGPTISAKLEQTSENVSGDWVIMGADDSLLLSERLLYPTPTSDDLANQVDSHDIRSGPAETVIKQYLAANTGSVAPLSRRVSNLSIQTDLGRGEVVYAAARFDQMQELFYNLAQVGGLGYKIEQLGTGLTFSVYEPLDRSSVIRLDLENQQLSKTEYAYGIAKITRAIVGGQGEAEQRKFLEVSTVDSLEAESSWGRRIEVFKDSRNTNEDDDLTQTGLEALVDEGKTVIEMTVSPSDDINMKYGKDWFLGDKVMVVANNIEATAVVTEIGISIQADGVRITSTVGTPVALDYESKLLANQSKQEERISSLERASTGYGINTSYQPEGGTSGTQPTFSGPAISGTFNRFGNMVHFNIMVDFNNILTFGTGQYYLTLPFASRNEIKFADGCLHDVSASRDYQIRGAVLAGSNVLKLSTTGVDGQKVYDSPFTFSDPVTLTTSDFFHIAGTYEIGE